MNGGGQGYQRYRREHWDEDASSSSANEAGHMSPYRGEMRGQHNRVPSNGYSSDPGSVGSAEDGPTYILEHLATFRVSPEAGLVYPSDGMRRLLHMEKSTGIWTQKMMLKLEKRWVSILSHENGDVVEKFPMELIREPTAFTSGDPKELYNNIFIFVVSEDPKRKYDNPTEMHIFQCMRISAKDVVEDMKLFMSGKSLNMGAIRGGGRAEHIPSPPREQAPEPPMLANGYRDFSDNDGRGETRVARSERSSVSQHDEVSSTSSERYERDVAILNNCFDDIERFIARLQHTAAATRELERRRRSRKSKKKDIGDGLLSMRAKPPPEREFVDIFQKFKLSFNLLARLRAFIRDPNAPELVHFLFTPLALLVDASRDSYIAPTLPPKVVAPLLTQDAIDLLTNCLTSRETELWQSLGEAWLVPREVWKYPVSSYRPVFYSGWAPEISDESRRLMIYTENPGEPELHPGFGGFDEPDTSEVSPPHSDIVNKYRPQQYSEKSHHPMTPEYHQDAMDPTIFERNQRKWLQEMKSRGAKIVQVTYPRTANNDKELTVVRGEYLEVVDDSRKWWKAMNSRGLTAHVPHTIVTPYAADEVSESVKGPPPPGRHGKKVKKNIISDGTSDDEIFRPLPKNKPRIPSSPPPDSEDNDTNPNYLNSHTALMNAELELALANYRKNGSFLKIHKTPDVFINQNSTPKQVESWLKAKDFNERIRKQFDGVDGEKLLSLTKNQLESICGKSDGSRLASQITIQRNISGYKTVRSTELKQALEQQRKRIEPYSKSSSKMKTNISSSDEEGVSTNFSFLNLMESSEEGSEPDIVPVKVKGGQQSSSRKSEGGTLRDQIKNQHKRILKSEAQVITNR